jgi:uncharacterized membrane protein YraQ (UPF0718 family)
MSNLQLTMTELGGQFLRIDRAWLASAIVLALLAAISTNEAKNSALFVIDNLIKIAPYLMLAISIAAFAKASDADALIARAFTGRMSIMILFAALFGGLSPFCSCGVIPLIAALLTMGVPVPAIMAFWLSSPVIDPSMFVLTVGTLGIEFAIGKTIAAIGIGLLGGFSTHFLISCGRFSAPIREGIGNGGCGGSAARDPGQVTWAFWNESKRRKAFIREALTTMLFLAKWLTLAFLLESLMITYIPSDAVATVLSPTSPWAIPIAVLVGVPAYMNGYAALPLVAGLLKIGVAPGAGMAFMVAGGVTSIPAAIAVYALVKRPLFLWYIALSLSGGLLSGLLYQMYAG